MEQFSSHPLYRRHTLDSAMSSLWNFYRNKFLVLFISSFVMSFIVQYISTTLDFSELTYMTDPYEMLEKVKEFIWPMVIISLINLLFTTILHYYVIYNPVDSSVNIFVASYKSLRYFLPYLIIIILFAFFGSFALVLGLFALIIGIFFVALYLMTVYLFFLPLLMVEGPNIGNAISRSFRLTHKGFWTNLGWVAVFALILIVISIILSMLIMIPFTGSIFKGITNPEEAVNALDYIKNPSFLILGSLGNALYFPLLPIFAAILYFNGRAKEDLYSKPEEEDK
ncbi:MAG: hypothetical protein A2V50_05115 [Bacteroidetes bacterium RBG_19FT_COMBO_42_10]|nr:MAG: hypothetical protein A2V50_05115 [Bacteroidetes bacterium RBG_19FT_COMBO_42_10]